MRGTAAVTILVSSVLAACTGHLVFVRPLPNAVKHHSAKRVQVPASRFDRLTRGVSLSHWFAQRPASDYTISWLENYYTKEDLEAIPQMGFRHVRIPVDFDSLGWNPRTKAFSSLRLEIFKGRIQALNNLGLMVIVDFHPSEEYKRDMATDPSKIQEVRDYWKTLAPSLALFSPDNVAVELLNEPTIFDGQKWWDIQGALLRQVRADLKQNTIIVEADPWAQHKELIRRNPYEDPNVIYNFHYYAPMAFTHQGSSGSGFKEVVGIRYPKSDSNVRSVKAKGISDSAMKRLTEMDEKDWNAAEHMNQMKAVAAWAAKYHVKVSCNEFGVWRYGTVFSDKVAWLRDVRTALERNGFAWTVWDYRGAFGLYPSENKPSRTEPEQLAALGLPKSLYQP